MEKVKKYRKPKDIFTKSLNKKVATAIKGRQRKSHVEFRLLGLLKKVLVGMQEINTSENIIKSIAKMNMLKLAMNCSFNVPFYNKNLI